MNIKARCSNSYIIINMSLIQTCEACIYKDQASPCAWSKTNKKCVFYEKPDKEQPKKDDSKSENDNAYDKGSLSL